MKWKKLAISNLFICPPLHINKFINRNVCKTGFQIVIINVIVKYIAPSDWKTYAKYIKMIRFLFCKSSCSSVGKAAHVVNQALKRYKFLLPRTYLLFPIHAIY